MKQFSTTDAQFLNLLRAGMWKTAPDAHLFEQGADWEAIITQARRQSVSPTIFDGMSLLPKPLQPEQKTLFGWYMDVMQTEQQNKVLNQTLAQLTARFRAEGLDPIVLKGQSVGRYYTDPSRRQPGDIDLYFPEGYERANALATQWAKQMSEKDQAEQDFVVQQGYVLHNGVVVENHREYAFFFSRRYQKAWAACEQKIGLAAEVPFVCKGENVKVLHPTINALYIFQHLLRHLLSFGVGFRQISDWIYFFVAEQANIDQTAFLHTAKEMGFTRPMAALAHIAVHHLGAPAIFPFDLTHPQVQEDADLLLTDVLEMGNFGHDTVAMRQKDSKDLGKKLGAYAAVVARFVRISRFGKREMLAACRFFVAKNWKNAWRYFLPSS